MEEKDKFFMILEIINQFNYFQLVYSVRMESIITLSSLHAIPQGILQF